MTSAELVSVAMPAYQAEAWIERAITSVLVQTWRELEVVVVDDASTDRTPDLVAAFRDSRVRLVRLEQNVGVGAASNVALAHARGELVARLDADDYALSHRLERQVAAMRADPSIAVLGSGYFEVDIGRRAPARVHRPFTGAGLHYALHLTCPLNHSSTMLRRSALPAHGYRPRRRGEDLALWLELVAAGQRLENLREPLVVYRRHPASLTGGGPARGTELRTAFLRNVLGLDVSVATVEAWHCRPGPLSSPRELATLARALTPDAVAARRPSLWPTWRGPQRAAAWRFYARWLARVAWHLRRWPRLAAAIAPTTVEAFARSFQG